MIFDETCHFHLKKTDYFSQYININQTQTKMDFRLMDGNWNSHFKVVQSRYKSLFTKFFAKSHAGAWFVSAKLVLFQCLMSFEIMVRVDFKNINVLHFKIHFTCLAGRFGTSIGHSDWTITVFKNSFTLLFWPFSLLFWNYSIDFMS